MITTCAKKGCAARSFMDSDRCFDHQPMPEMPGTGLFKAWFVFVAILALATLAGAAWAVFELVTWVTQK